MLEHSGMTAASPRIGICVVHWRSPDVVTSTLSQLLASSGVDLDVVVVDNASGDSDVAQLRQQIRGPIRLVEMPRNYGFAAGANVGFRLLRDSVPANDYIAVSAHDTLLEQDTLALLANALACNPSLGVVGPLFESGNSAKYVEDHSYRLSPQSWRATSLTQSLHACDWLPGALMMFRPSALASVGMFDERLFAYVEDVDISLRMWRKGWEVAYLDSARARERGSVISTPGHVYMIARNHLLIARWHLPAKSFIRLVITKTTHVLRAYLASHALWRSADRRVLSRIFARSQRQAVIDAVCGRSGPADWEELA